MSRHADTRTAETCQRCGAACCRYVAIEIDRPTAKTDYDHVRWYLLHVGVTVFIDHDNRWFVEFETPCRELKSDHLCGRYRERPRICRSHGDEDESCEYFATPYKRQFRAIGEFEAYLEKRGIDWRFKQLPD